MMLMEWLMEANVATYGHVKVEGMSLMDIWKMSMCREIKG